MVADDEDLPLDASFACGPVGGQDVDVEVIVTGEADRFRMERDRLARCDVAADDRPGPVVDDRHRDAVEVRERSTMAVEERLQVLARGEAAERVARVRQRAAASVQAAYSGFAPNDLEPPGAQAAVALIRRLRPYFTDGRQGEL